MSKAKLFFGGSSGGSLYRLFVEYNKWLEEKPVKVVSVVHDGSALLVTYEEL